jgi:XisI protein
MDSVIKHKSLVRKMLSEIADHFRQGKRWEILEAFDEEHGQYLLFTDGWQGESRE